MRLCMNSMTVHEVMCEQQCYACETNESSKGKWKMERCNGTMMTKKEQRKKIVTVAIFDSHLGIQLDPQVLSPLTPNPSPFPSSLSCSASFPVVCAHLCCRPHFLIIYQ